MSKHEDERRCENCWYCQEFESKIMDRFTYEMKPNGKAYECRFNPPRSEPVYVYNTHWCGRFYSKDMPPPWKPQLIHRLEPT